MCKCYKFYFFVRLLILVHEILPTVQNHNIKYINKKMRTHHQNYYMTSLKLNYKIDIQKFGL